MFSRSRHSLTSSGPDGLPPARFQRFSGPGLAARLAYKSRRWRRPGLAARGPYKTGSRGCPGVRPSVPVVSQTVAETRRLQVGGQVPVKTCRCGCSPECCPEHPQDETVCVGAVAVSYRQSGPGVQGRDRSKRVWWHTPKREAVCRQDQGGPGRAREGVGGGRRPERLCQRHPCATAGVPWQ